VKASNSQHGAGVKASNSQHGAGARASNSQHGAGARAASRWAYHASSRAYDYLAVGHVTIDVIADRPGGPVEQVGGGAFYSALQAARLGLRALIVTRGVPDAIETMVAPYRSQVGSGGGRLDVTVLPAPVTTTLLTTGVGPKRRQQVKSWAGPIERLPDVDSEIVHFAPVAQETPREVPPGAGFVGLTPQGLVRAWRADGWISLVPLDRDSVPAQLDAVVFSQAEHISCSPLLQLEGPAAEAVVAITAGSQATELRLPGGETQSVASIGVRDPREDLGAGDVFAAALFIALWRGEGAVEAVRYASAAAAVRVRGLGGAAVGGPAAIQAALAAS
jgi:sugar/nucleoside kinase (ribokinase family)